MRTVQRLGQTLWELYLVHLAPVCRLPAAGLQDPQPGSYEVMEAGATSRPYCQCSTYQVDLPEAWGIFLTHISSEVPLWRTTRTRK